MSTDTIAGVLGQAFELGLFDKRWLYVGAEIRTPDGGDSWSAEPLGRKALEGAWERAGLAGEAR